MQFSLKTLLWGTTYCAVACGALVACSKAIDDWQFPSRTAMVAAALIVLAWWRAEIKADAFAGLCLLAIGVQLTALAALDAMISTLQCISVDPPKKALTIAGEQAIKWVAIDIAPALCVLMPAVVGCIRRPARGTKLVIASIVLCVLSSALTILTVLEAIRRQDLR